MIEQSLTEAARRSLRQAARLAEAAQARQVEPYHLLAALSADQSRASEILAEHGLCSATEPPDVGPEPSAGQDTLEPDGAQPTCRHSELLRKVLDAAGRHVGLMGRGVQVGTEHLLLGLASIESPVAETLRRHGLDPETLRRRIATSSGVTDEPIAVDVDFNWHRSTETDRTDIFRVIDAAANRAREGLRVVEDFVRFVMDDAYLSGLLKECRHDLARLLAGLGFSGLLAARDTQRDVGTEIGTPAEYSRRCPADVAEANFKRLQEAVRTLEEFAKITSPSVGESMGRLRYRLYTVEKAVCLTRRSRGRLEGRRLYLLLTESSCHHGSGPALRESLAAGVDMVQVREKSMGDRGLVEHGRRVRRWTREAGALYIMNDRPDLAVLTDADGVHVGQDELTVREARRIVGPHRIVGASTHTVEQARQAVLDGADYIGVGPVFPSATKQFETYAGLELVRQVAAEITLPWFAIGGITPENVAQVVSAGAARIAVSGALCGAENPADCARQLRQTLAKADELRAGNAQPNQRAEH